MSVYTLCLNILYSSLKIPENIGAVHAINQFKDLAWTAEKNDVIITSGDWLKDYCRVLYVELLWKLPIQ